MYSETTIFEAEIPKDNKNEFCTVYRIDNYTEHSELPIKTEE